MAKQKVAMLTAGGSRALSLLRCRRPDRALQRRRARYRDHRLSLRLSGRSARRSHRDHARHARDAPISLHRYGGSPIGNSRVKLTNAADCVKRGLVKEGENPLRVAAERLASDGVTILHTIGGDDTNTTAADLAAYLGANGYDLTVVGLPKTVDNDVVPIRQSLGAWTAAEVGATFLRQCQQRTERRAAHARRP